MSLNRQFEKSALETAGAINARVEDAQHAREMREAAAAARKAREQAEYDAAVARLEEASKPVLDLLNSVTELKLGAGFSQSPDVKHNCMRFTLSANPNLRFDSLNEFCYSLEITVSPGKKTPFSATGLVSVCRDPNEKISLATRFCRLVASIDPWGPSVTVKSAEIAPIAAMVGRWMGSMFPEAFKQAPSASPPAP